MLLYVYGVKFHNIEVGLKLNIQKTKIVASGPITSWQIVGEALETGRLQSMGLLRVGHD